MWRNLEIYRIIVILSCSALLLPTPLNSFVDIFMSGYLDFHPF